jgi:hypothetical protein
MIEEAWDAYRCPKCGSAAQFYKEELSVTRWTYNPKKQWWDYERCTPGEEYGYHSAQDDYLKADTICCCTCHYIIKMPEGSPVNTIHMEDWLKDLACRWQEQKAQRQKLQDELAAAQENFNPVGFVADLEAKIKALEVIS